MALYIRTSDTQIPLRDQTLNKGQIYNLDTNEGIDFQFNPQLLEWSEEDVWAEICWKGARRGGDLQFQYSGPRILDLDLIFIADPGAPGITYHATSNATIPLTTNQASMDFEVILNMFQQWRQPIVGKGRPCRVLVILGPFSVAAVILKIVPRITEFFNDLSAREGTISLSLREWLLEGEVAYPRILSA